MIDKVYADFAWQQTEQLLSIDSPTGFTNYAAAWVQSSFMVLGFDAKITTIQTLWAQWLPRSKATAGCG